MSTIIDIKKQMRFYRLRAIIVISNKIKQISYKYNIITNCIIYI